MAEVIYILFLSLVVVYADFRMTQHNFGAKWNGIGCTPDVLAGHADQPMQYRVLVPWLCKLFGGMLMKTYLRIRWMAILFAVSMSYMYFDHIGLWPVFPTALMCLFFVLAALYDYTDVYFEVGFFALAFMLICHSSDMSYLWLALVIIPATLNRETAVFIPMVAVLQGHISLAVYLFALFACTYNVPRMIYGHKKRYCEFFTLRRNLRTIRETYSNGGKEWRPWLLNECSLFFVVFLLTVGLYIYSYSQWGLLPVEIAMGVLFVAMLVPSMWREIRVFAPTMLAVIPMAVRGILWP